MHMHLLHVQLTPTVTTHSPEVRDMSSTQFDGKVVLITGGGGGIGRAAAQRFLDEGASVVLSGTRAAVLEDARAAVDPYGERTAIRAGAITGRDDAREL